MRRAICELFFDLLDAKLALVAGQLDERFEIQARKKVYNAPFLMGQGVWIDSENLAPGDEQREVLKHGTLTTGFIGLAGDARGLDGQASRRIARGAAPGTGDRGAHAQQR